MAILQLPKKAHSSAVFEVKGARFSCKSVHLHAAVAHCLSSKC